MAKSAFDAYMTGSPADRTAWDVSQLTGEIDAVQRVGTSPDPLAGIAWLMNRGGGFNGSVGVTDAGAVSYPYDFSMGDWPGMTSPGDLTEYPGDLPLPDISEVAGIKTGRDERGHGQEGTTEESEGLLDRAGDVLEVLSPFEDTLKEIGPMVSKFGLAHLTKGASLAKAALGLINDPGAGKTTLGKTLVGLYHADAEKLLGSTADVAGRWLGRLSNGIYKAEYVLGLYDVINGAKDLGMGWWNNDTKAEKQGVGELFSGISSLSLDHLKDIAIKGGSTLAKVGGEAAGAEAGVGTIAEAGLIASLLPEIVITAGSALAVDTIVDAWEGKKTPLEQFEDWVNPHVAGFARAHPSLMKMVPTAEAAIFGPEAALVQSVLSSSNTGLSIVPTDFTHGIHLSDLSGWMAGKYDRSQYDYGLGPDPEGPHVAPGQAADEVLHSVGALAHDALTDGVDAVSSFGHRIAGVGTDIASLIGYESMPPFAKLAEGGITTRAQMALVGEAGPEAIIPLNQFRPGGLQGGGRGHQITVNIPISVVGKMDDEALAQLQHRLNSLDLSALQAALEQSADADGLN